MIKALRVSVEPERRWPDTYVLKVSAHTFGQRHVETQHVLHADELRSRFEQIWEHMGREVLESLKQTDQVPA